MGLNGYQCCYPLIIKGLILGINCVSTVHPTQLLNLPGIKSTELRVKDTDTKIVLIKSEIKISAVWNNRLLVKSRFLVCLQTQYLTMQLFDNAGFSSHNTCRRYAEGYSIKAGWQSELHVLLSKCVEWPLIIITRWVTACRICMCLD